MNEFRDAVEPGRNINSSQADEMVQDPVGNLGNVSPRRKRQDPYVGEDW